MERESGEIENVSSTALWVATYRAQESKRPDALFRDPYAEVLAGEKGPRIVASIPGGGFSVTLELPYSAEDSPNQEVRPFA